MVQIAVAAIAALGGWLGKSAVAKRTAQAELTLRIQEVYSDFVTHTKEQMAELHKEIDELKESLVANKKAYSALKREFTLYKKKHP